MDTIKNKVIEKSKISNQYAQLSKPVLILKHESSGKQCIIEKIVITSLCFRSSFHCFFTSFRWFPSSFFWFFTDFHPFSLVFHWFHVLVLTINQAYNNYFLKFGLHWPTQSIKSITINM